MVCSSVCVYTCDLIELLMCSDGSDGFYMDKPTQA